MSLIDEMAKELRIVLYGIQGVNRETQKVEIEIGFERKHKINNLLTKYQAEKELLEKTQEWHEHGTIAPSCVGCPTAKAMIEKKNLVTVRRDRLEEVHKSAKTRLGFHVRGNFDWWLNYLVKGESEE